MCDVKPWRLVLGYSCKSHTCVTAVSTVQHCYVMLLHQNLRNFADSPEYDDPGTQVGEEGMDLTVMLAVDANPYPSHFTWLKDGVEIIPDDRVMIGVTYIQFNPLNREDSGEYTVRANNSEGSGPPQSFELDVLCKLGGSLPV